MGSGQANAVIEGKYPAKCSLLSCAVLPAQSCLCWGAECWAPATAASCASPAPLWSRFAMGCVVRAVSAPMMGSGQGGGNREEAEKQNIPRSCWKGNKSRS